MSETKLNPQVEELFKSLIAALAQTPSQLETRQTEIPEGYVPIESVKSFKLLEKYGDILTVKDIQAILMVSEPKAYEILNSDKCPTFSIGKAGKRIRKDSFMNYLKENEHGSLLN